MKHEPAEKSPGLFLSEPALLTRKVSFLSPFFFYFPLLLLGGCSAVFCFYTAFSLPVSLPLLFLYNLLFSALSAFLFLQKKHRALCTLLLPGLLLFGILFWFSSFGAGLFYTVNRVLCAYTERTGLSLPALSPGVYGRKEILFFSSLFAAALTLMLQWVLAWALIRKNSGFFAFSATGLLLLVPMIFSILPHPFAQVLILLFWGSLLLLRPVLTGGKGVLKTRKSFHISGALAARAAVLPILFLVCLFLFLASQTGSKERYSRPQLIDDIRSGVFHGAQLPSRGRTTGIGKNSARVDLKELGDRTYTGKTMLRVKTSKAAPDYLKGFCGSVYTGESWEQRSGEQNEAAQDALGEEKAQFLNARLLSLFSPKEDGGRSSYTLTVQNVGANPRCAYLPYGVTKAGLSQTIEPVEDGFFQTKNRLFGETAYFASALWDKAQEGALPFFSVLLRSSAEGSSWEEPFFRLEEMSIVLPFQTRDLWIPERLSSLPQKDAGFLVSLRRYSQFVYETDTLLPEALQKPLFDYLQTRGLLPANYGSSQELAEAIVKAVQSECTYTLSPGVCPEEEDFVLYFLLKSRKGYCVHFASAAALLIRAAGIPARYAEGYVAPPGSGEGSWAELPDHSAHAWVEIYSTGSGWTPLEATPGMDFSDASERPDHTVSSPSPIPSSPPPAFTPSPEVSGTESSSPTSSLAEATPKRSPSPTGNAVSSGSAQAEEKTQNTETPLWSFFLLLPAAGVFCVFAGLSFRRKRKLSRRKKALSSENRNEAALACYARILALQSYLPFEGPPALDEGLEELAMKARFSQHMLSSQELSLFEARLKAHIAFLEKTLSPLERWRCRYLLVLF